MAVSCGVDDRRAKERMSWGEVNDRWTYGVRRDAPRAAEVAAIAAHNAATRTVGGAVHDHAIRATPACRRVLAMTPPTTTAVVEVAPSHDFSVAPPARDGAARAARRDRHRSRPRARARRRGLKRLLDITAAVLLLLLCLPLFLVVAALIKLDSRGPLFYGCRRVGRDGRELMVLKFRKMRDGASGPALTLGEDERFTRIGPFLAATKIDELPQLINVLRGDMSLVGPRPEDAGFVDLQRESYDEILRVKPGMTGLTQLAFANEREILDPDDALGHYVERLLPQKVRIDTLYATRRSTLMDLRILLWTAVAVLLRRDVAVNRESARITLRRRAPEHSGASPLPAPTADDRRRA